MGISLERKGRLRDERVKAAMGCEDVTERSVTGLDATRGLLFSGHEGFPCTNSVSFFSPAKRRKQQAGFEKAV